MHPDYPAAVVAGNVETSQCITDALYGALGVMAAAQGTMNNLSFGNAEFQYYETICGGAGAGPEFDGASAVQTHITNSRMTDVARSAASSRGCPNTPVLIAGNAMVPTPCASACSKQRR